MTDGAAFHSAGGMGVGQDLFRANPQSQQFVALMHGLYRAMSPLYDPDSAALADPNWWNKVNRDTRFRAYTAMRLAKVARMSWVMESASDKRVDVDAAATCEHFFRQIPMFTSSRRHLAKSAFWGRSNAWVEGKRKWALAGVSEQFPDGYLAEWWTPTLIRPLDKRQIIYQPKRIEQPDGTFKIGVETLLGTIDAGLHKAMEHGECLVTCVYDDEVERLGHGRGLGEPLYHAYWVKGIVQRIGLGGLEKWAYGIVLASLDANARAGKDETALQTATATLAAIKSMRQDGAIVMDSRDKLEVKTMQGGGDAATRAWMDYIDEGAQLLCTGGLRQMGAGQGGGRAQAETEADSSDDLLDADREMIDEQITLTVIRLWWDLNGGILAAMGLGAAQMPRFRSLRTDHEDPEKVGRILESAQKVGMKLGADDAHRRMGVKKPSADEELLEAPKPESPFGGGLPGLGGGPGEGQPFGEPKDDEPAAKLWRRFRAALLHTFGRRAA